MSCVVGLGSSVVQWKHVWPNSGRQAPVFSHQLLKRFFLNVFRVNFNPGKFVLLVFADGQPTNHQSTVMTTSTNIDSITTNIRQWNECLNWFILHLDHDLLQSEGDWSVPNLSAFVCHSVRNWWETIQAESLPHRDMKQMRKTAAGSFSLYQFH